MAFPKPTLSQSMSMFWRLRSELAKAASGKRKRAITEAVEDLEMMANHSPHQSVRDAALRAIEEHGTVLPTSASVSNLARGAPQRLAAEAKADVA